MPHFFPGLKIPTERSPKGCLLYTSTGIKSDTYEYFDQNTHRQRITCKVCNYKGMSVSSAHTETKAATCQSPAYCGACQSYYGNPAHDKVQHEAKAPTCTTIGWDAYETCSRCDYTTYVEKTANCLLYTSGIAQIAGSVLKFVDGFVQAGFFLEILVHLL